MNKNKPVDRTGKYTVKHVFPSLTRTAAAMAVSSTILAGSSALAADWSTVANSNTAIPSGNGALFSSFGQPSVNNNCQIVFRGRSAGPEAPVRGIYNGDACNTATALGKLLATGDEVPQPNNLAAGFNEFPAFPRIDLRNNFVATRGQSSPVWEYTLPDGSDTRVGTSGVYAGLIGGGMVTGASLLGAIPAFSYYEVPRFPGVRFDQFPGAPAAFDGSRIAFKGNFTDGTTSRTGVYVRDVFLNGGTEKSHRVADTKTTIPGTDAKFGSTAPPSAADSTVMFAGFDNEDAPTLGGIYKAVAPDYNLETIVAIGAAVPHLPSQTFTKFGEGLSFDGKNVGFWGAWGTAMRKVTLHCPVDGNKDVIAECIKQCPDVDETGNYCVKEVPRNQGLFVRRNNGNIRMIAQAGRGREFEDFLFWVFSGRPPGVGQSEGEDFELPRWRSSAFIAVSPNGGAAASAFKALKFGGEVGIYKKIELSSPAEPVMVVGQDAAAIDAEAPAGSVVTAVGLERDGFRNCVLALNASFLNTTTSESWAGVYSDAAACAPAP